MGNSYLQYRNEYHDDVMEQETVSTPLVTGEFPSQKG